MARHQVAAVRTAFRYGGKLRIYGLSNRGQPTGGGPPAWRLSEVLTTPHRKKLNMLRNIHRGLGIGPILRYNLTGGGLLYMR
jgi:hypothetical protein